METQERWRSVVVAFDAVVFAEEAKVVTVIVQAFLEREVGEVVRLLKCLLALITLCLFMVSLV